MGVPQSVTPNPTSLVTHNTRTPDANPIVGGPYLQGYDPTATKSADSGRLIPNSLPGLTVPATAGNAFTPSGTIKQETSSGDQPGLAYNQLTEDHAE